MRDLRYEREGHFFILEMISEKPIMSQATPSNMLLNAETKIIEESALSNNTKSRNDTQKHDKRSNKKEMKTEHSPFVQPDISENTNYINEYQWTIFHQKSQVLKMRVQML